MAKVLVAGPDFYNYNDSVGEAFRNLGFETKVFNYSGDNLNTLYEKILFKLSLHSSKYFELKQKLVNNLFLAEYNSYKPDIVFIIHGWYLFDDTIKKLNGSLRILWLMDSIDRYGAKHTLPELVDYNFFFEKTDIEKVQGSLKKKSCFLPLALDEKVYFPTNEEKTIDLSFVGFLFEKRVRLLHTIIKEFKGACVKIYGATNFPKGSELYKITRSYPEAFMLKTIRPVLVNKLYNQSKVCLNVHHAQSIYGVNQRFFEVSGSRSFQLVEKNPYISDNFSEGEIVTYETEDELLQKIQYYLNDGPARARCAEAAYKKVISEHTFTHRIKYVLEVVNKSRPIDGPD